MLQSLKGPASDYIGRLLKEKPNANWQEIKKALIIQYSEEGDTFIALQTLRQIKQNKGETIQTFGERLLGLAREAYGENDIKSKFVQNDLLSILFGAVRDEPVARKLISSRPKDVYEALDIASNMQQCDRVFNLRRRAEEPMEVNEVTSLDSQSRLDKLESNMQVIVDQMGQLLKEKGSQTKIKHSWTEDGQPICGFCKKPDHVFKNCFKRKNSKTKKEN